MIIPIRCFTCNKVTGDSWEAFCTKTHSLSKNDDDKDVKKHVKAFREILKKDHALKKSYNVKTIQHRLSDHAIADWLDKKSQTWFGTKEVPSLPLYGELPPSMEARQKVLFQIMNNIGKFEAKWSLISLLAHPKTALGNIVGSNIFNIVGIVGVISIITPLDIPSRVLNIDGWVMLGATLLLMPYIIGRWTRLSRFEAFLFLLAYLIYIFSVTYGADTLIP